MGAEAILMLILQYGPVAYKIEQAAQPFLIDLVKQFEAKGSSPTDAIAKAFSMHITAPAQWTAEEYAIWFAKAGGAGNA